jgi:diadenosine tetraphosphatase ApaH/serine/threonine PP2A family protein phosphatase
MKLAILSDIHSNLEALTVCVRHAEAHGAERFICLGDCIGYGADPAPTLRLLMALPGIVRVRGNHDEALFRPVTVRLDDIREAIDWTRAQLSEDLLRFLSEAPYVYREGDATYVHASASAPEQWTYLYGPQDIGPCLAAAGTPLTFIGHVHVPRVFYESADGVIRELEPHPDVPIPLSPRSRYVINVGSVGQPRDGNSGACYVLYDTAAGEITFHRLSYDYFATAEKIRAAGLNPRFAERLAQGR